MCSVNDCDFDQLLISKNKDENESKNTKCKKCLEKEPSILLRGKDAYCQCCFLMAATHKFRATLGKSKIVRPNDNVLVAHSGKAGSTALLHLIKAGMHESVHKRLIFKTTVLYIDEYVLYGNKMENRLSTIKKINNQVKDLGFHGFSTTLSEIFNPIEIYLEPLDSTKIHTIHDETLLNCFNSLCDMTSKEDFLTKIRHKLIVAAARKLNCNKVFLGNDMTNLSIKILENISLGRAAHLSLDIGFTDTRYQDLMLLRPMKDFSKKELHYYINYFKLNVIHLNEFNIEKDSLVSIKKLTEKFVNQLDAESNSTVSTIFRIAEKLGSNLCTKKDSNDSEICILCEAQLDTSTAKQEICSIAATSFSKLVSKKGINFEKNISKKNTNEGISKNCGSECSGDCENMKNNIQINVNNILKYFCYGCRLIIKNFKTPEDIPDFLYKKVIEQISLENMRSEIEQFLL